MAVLCVIIWNMNRRIVRTIAYMLIGVISTTVLTGCDLVPSLNLTEEQSTLIAEYAAGKLIEYVKGHPGGLMILDDVDRADVNPGLKKDEPEPMPETVDPLPPPVDAPSLPEEEGENPTVPDAQPEQEALVDAPEDISSTSTKSIAEALGISGAELQYDHFETAMTYPDNTELAFTMKAAPGKELLIVHFLLTNPGDSDIEAHSDSSNFKVRLMLNGSEIT